MKRIIGKVLMFIGLVVPLVVFSILSSKIIFADQAYNNFHDEVVSRNMTVEEFDNRVRAYQQKISSDAEIVDPFDGTTIDSRYNILSSNDGVFGYIQVPSIGAKMPIYLGASEYHLSLGTAHVDGTDLPVGGEGTRSVIAGHRGYLFDIVFYDAELAKPGDMAYIDNGKEVLQYRMINSEVISPPEWEKLQPIEGKDMLTLLTCEPKNPPRPRRLLLNFERVYPEDSEYTLGANGTNSGDSTSGEQSSTQGTSGQVNSSGPMGANNASLSQAFESGTDRSLTISQKLIIVVTGLLFVLFILWILKFIVLDRKKR